MRLLEINSVCGSGSTGRIALDIANEYADKGYEVKIAYGRGETSKEASKYAIRIGNESNIVWHGIVSRIFDNHGLCSRKATRNFLKWAEDYNPDILWIHNIHGYFINYEMLFAWIKTRPNMLVRWTLHDCWAFTGHCSHFTIANCDKWKQECVKCPQKDKYPASYLKDNSLDNFRRKKAAFSNVNNMEIYTPSQWLRERVCDSFLNQYKVTVVPNKCDTTIFRPTLSSFREENGISENQVMLLGVSNVWPESKGLSDFLNLYSVLDKTKYKIVLVGLSKKQISELPKDIIAFGRVEIERLTKIYSAADFYINPSREETFSLTTLEALCCGTQAIVYKGTACEEVALQYGGVAVDIGIENIYNYVMEHSKKVLEHNE